MLDAATTAKIACMVLTGVVPVILGLIPLKVGRYINAENIRHQVIVSCLLCFGGGILLATSMLHMLPEVNLLVFHTHLLTKS